MTLFLRKYFWALNLLTIALCTLFAAKAVGRWVESSLPAPRPRRISAPPPSLSQAMGGPAGRDITQVLGRNIFCSTCEPAVEVAKVENGDSSEPASNEPVKTSLNLKLIATLISDQDKAWSFAAIEDSGDETTRMFAIGSKVTGEAVVTDIMERRVFLQNGNRNEYLDLEDGDQVGRNIEQSSPAVSFSSPSVLPEWQDVAKGIRKIGEGKYEIDRSALNKVLANTTMLARSARIVPSVRNGQPNGFKLYAIRPGSLYSMLGMFNGDTLNAINGHPIITPDKALEVYTKLRSASHVTISFSRRGTQVTHEYNIR